VIYAPKSVGTPPQELLNGFRENDECVVTVSRLGTRDGGGSCFLPAFAPYL
jgi:hypothetical protein